MSAFDVIELAELAHEIAAEAAVLAADMRTDGVRVRATKWNELDIVTHADLAVESLIRSRLAQARRRDGILGEETGDVRGESEITWVVDPIDGTVNYLYGSPHYAVSIAAVTRTPEGELVGLAGCVHAPALSLVYTAAMGHPATRNGREIHANLDVPLDKALVSTGVPYDREARRRVLADLEALLPAVRDVRLCGSAALDICGVAEGRLDAHVGRRLPVWDYAAAGLIASQSGASVRGPHRRPPGLDRVVVAADALADALEPLLN